MAEAEAAEPPGVGEARSAEIGTGGTAAAGCKLALDTDAAMPHAPKALVVVDSSIAQAKIAFDTPIVHVEAVLMALITDAPVTVAGADSTALKVDALVKPTGANRVPWLRQWTLGWHMFGLI